ncbi:hypothetical protein Hc94105_0649 [Helicobacter cinaedi]|uniref:polyphenol oxidase family protein n=1 Tax=Helicobacter cinaedi TaxID=213 RepID=UPI001F2F9BF9|nr:polyphenol oxidase family protein [Helicobacter cinaedi]BDB66457.1 hypothetical protein Hc94105_0649 [Helicobacter cinaedi]
MFFYTSLESPLFRNENVYFALSDRYGGVSEGVFNTLNLGYGVGDDKQRVDINHRRVKEAFVKTFGKADFRVGLGTSESGADKDLTKNLPMFYCQQIHSTKSVIVDEKLVSKYRRCDGGSMCLGEADAIITHLPNVLVFVMVADCNPILLYDRKNGVVSVIHAGRKGVFDGILLSSFMHMRDVYGTRVEDCLMYVGASIRSCCYEVGEEIRTQAEILGFNDVFQGKNLDLIACLKQQSENLGLKPSQVEISPFCSSCEGGLYSYRRDHSTGRFGLLAMLKKGII